MTHNHEEEGIQFIPCYTIFSISHSFEMQLFSCMNKKGTNDDDDDDEHKGPS